MFAETKTRIRADESAGSSAMCQNAVIKQSFTINTIIPFSFMFNIYMHCVLARPILSTFNVNVAPEPNRLPTPGLHTIQLVNFSAKDSLCGCSWKCPYWGPQSSGDTDCVTPTHKLFLELRQLAFIEPSFTNRQKLPAQNLRQLRPRERGRRFKEWQVL